MGHHLVVYKCLWSGEGMEESSLGLANASQIVSPTKPLDLWHRSRGYRWCIYLWAYFNVRLDLLCTGIIAP